MVPKTERFELRLDEDTLEKIDIWRGGQRGLPSRSEAVRKLVAAGLGQDTDKQLFQLARFNVLCAARTHDANVMTDAYVYAWAEGVYPLFDEGSEQFHKSFSSHFDVSEEMLDELSKLLDDREKEESVPSFYELEDYYGTRRNSSRWGRMSLIQACRYMYLREMWGENFWGALLRGSDHPSEAKSIIRKFDRKKDIYLP